MKQNLFLVLGMSFYMSISAFGQSSVYVDVNIEITPDLVMAEVVNINLN